MQGETLNETSATRKPKTSEFCTKCNAWRGSLGLEPTLDLYISHLVEIFREVRRVMKPEATLWLNHGDSYCGGGRAGNNPEYYGKHKMFGKTGWDPGVFGKPQPVPVGLKPKDLIGQPWRLAFALQADGWWLRSDVIEEVELYCPHCGYVLEERIWRWSQDRDLIWSKPNPMPESVKGTGYYRHKIRQITNGKKEWIDCPGCEKCNPHDGYVLRWNAGRPTKSHEYIFLLSKSAKYYYDAEAVREEAEYGRREWTRGAEGNLASLGGGRGSSYVHGGNPETGRNKRTVWTVATQSFDMEMCLACRTIYDGRTYKHLSIHIDNKGKEHRICRCGIWDQWMSHFATFPEKLIEPCIRAGTSEKGYCAECGKPWVRVIKEKFIPQPDVSRAKGIKGAGNQKPMDASSGWDGVPRGSARIETLGWQPSCSCGADIIPGLVLDPFGGAGTVALEAKKLNRDFLIIELKPEYCDMSRKRLAERMPLFVGEGL